MVTYFKIDFSWKLDKNTREKEYHKDDQASFNDTRSSVSSINTLNEVRANMPIN